MPKESPPKRAQKHFNRAKAYADDPKKTADLLARANKKAQKNTRALATVWDDLTALFRLVGSWVGGKYKDVPTQTILLAIGAIVYFVSPIDAIPDFIPVVGLIDDAGVIGWVIKSIRGDVKRFRDWEAADHGDGAAARA